MRTILFLSQRLGVFLIVLLVSQTRAAELGGNITWRLKTHRGKVAVAVKHLTTGESYEYESDTPMPTASLIKLPILIEVYRQAAKGKVDLNALVTLREEDKVPGSGVLTPHFSAGTKLPLKDAVRLMIAYSDNTATNLVLDQIGLKATNELMEQLGFSNTKIHAKVFRRETSIHPDRSEKFGLGSTTAKEMVMLLEQLHHGKLASGEHTNAVLKHLSNCQNTTRISRWLPSGTKVAHKTGSVSGVKTDAGIINTPSGPIAICILTAENQDRTPGDDNAGNRLCGQVAKVVYDHFQAARKSEASDPKQLKLGASSVLVEDLQRTLNARLNPSPKLTVDGEFGLDTEQAVKEFQTKKNLTADGIVGEDTWKALGVLVTSIPPVPSPAEVNNKELPVSKPDDITGPPLVTCKAWAIADANTGKLVKGSRAEDRKNFASTTKIMTAYIVLKLAENQPDVLEEEVTFSERADRTGGSSAKIRKGERLPVKELLYGLMLPSGNDASVALAEHFGGRFPDKEEKDPLSLFVTEMNRTAKLLGMNKTTYKNPHGLTAKDHLSTAHDLTKLAHAAIQIPKFRHYISTRQHGATVNGLGGYQRHIVWKNTNQLLGIQGFKGIKTGTTSAAGACLVSWGERGESSIIVVVLGATSSDARYVDSRNLYRWWWREGSVKQ